MIYWVYVPIQRISLNMDEWLSVNSGLVKPLRPVQETAMVTLAHVRTQQAEQRGTGERLLTVWTVR